MRQLGRLDTLTLKQWHHCSTRAQFHFSALAASPARRHRVGVSELGGALDDLPPLPPLKCPGGPRMSSQDIKLTHKVPSNGYLKADDLRFIINLKLTHLLMSYLNRHRRDDRLYVEIGPGPGTLTRSLLTQSGVGVLGIEIDPRWNSHLETIAQHTNGRFKWSNADVLHIDEVDVIQQHYAGRVDPIITPTNVAKEKGLITTSTEERLLERQNQERWRNSGSPQIELVGNLPYKYAYHLASRYAVDCSRKDGVFRFGRVPCHLFFQSDFAARLIAMPGQKAFGRASVVLQNYFHVQLRADFRTRTFYPITEVHGALVTLEPRVEPLVHVDAVPLMSFVSVLMNENARNKSQSLLSSLMTMMPEEVARYILAELGISPDVWALDCGTIEIAKMALLWQRFIEATNQPPAQDISFDHIASCLQEEAAVENHDFCRGQYEGGTGGDSSGAAASEAGAAPSGDTEDASRAHGRPMPSW
jgi:16S rRNA A1518/A1519 N6-dimethyltransferase RsmA/KsgA/DIM1 with predicted DNA glycosylase/AP lyase activity